MTHADAPESAPSTQPWWRSAVIYQIYPRSFADANGDGIGDLAGIIGKLDYLVELGVDAIWFSPFFTSPQDDNGYDVASYTDVDPLFGDLATCDALIAACHRRGLKVILDLVLNHTSDEHPWFVESRDPASDKRDWYHWRDPRPGFVGGSDGAEPTNWAAVFGGSAWEFDEASGQYYLHLFSRRQPDLNWHSEPLRAEIMRILRWWRDRGVDGFRLDVINFIGKRMPLADGVVDPGDRWCHDLLAQCDEDITHGFLRQLKAEVLDGHDLVTIGEMPGVTVDAARRFTDADGGELSMVFTFEHMEVDQRPGGAKWDWMPLDLVRLKAVLAHWQTGLADVGWNALYLGNHDQPRIVSRWGDPSPAHRVASAKTWATVLHLMKGTPFIYQGEEIGMTNAGFTSLAQYRDIESLNAARDMASWGWDEERILRALAVKSRDNARTPMQWVAGPGAGFGDGAPWLAIHPNHDEINVDAAWDDPGSVFHHYRALIELRHSLRIVREGTFELLCADDARLFAYVRRLDGHMLLVVANCCGKTAALPTGVDDFPTLAGAHAILRTHDADDETLLQPWESRVYLWTPAAG